MRDEARSRRELLVDSKWLAAAICWALVLLGVVVFDATTAMYRDGMIGLDAVAVIRLAYLAPSSAFTAWVVGAKARRAFSG